MPERLVNLVVERICLRDRKDCPVKGQSAFVPIRANSDESGESLANRAIEQAIICAKLWSLPNPCNKCGIGVGGDGVRKGVIYNPRLSRGIKLPEA